MLRPTLLLIASLAASFAVAAEDDSKEQKLAFGKPRRAERSAGFGPEKPGEASAASRTSDRDRDYARGLLTKYDTNRDRVLDQGEWSQISGEPEKADSNNDGRLTFDELVARVSQKRREKEVTASGAAIGDRRSYRLKTPAEKLPEGLPSWFAQRDANGDGQVAMHEWSRTWSDYTVRDFTTKDTSGDGIITVEEAQATTR